MKGLVISPIIKTIFISLATAIILYAAVGFLILPAVISNQLPKLSKEHLNRSAQLEEIKFNPFSMELTLQGFKLNNTDDTAFVGFDQFYLNVAVIQSILDLSFKMDKVLLKSPDILITRNQQADFNFSDLLSEKQEKEEKEENPTENDEIFPVTIGNISILTGKLNWKDESHSKSQHETVSPINLSIDNFTTIIHKQSNMGFSLKFASGGEFNWNGQLELSPLSSSGTIKLSKIDFNKVWHLFLEDTVNFKILSGSENIEANYQLSETAEGIQVFINQALVNLYDIKLSEKGSADSVISIPEFTVSGIAVDVLKKQVEIAEVSAARAEFIAWLNADGSINYQSLFAPQNKQPQAPATAPAVAEETSEPWQVNLNKLNLTDFSLDFTDKTLATPVKLALSSVNLSSTELTNKTGATLPFKLALKLNKKGHLQVNGNAILEPLSSNINLAVNDIAINDFQPYISKFARLDIISGLFNIDANIVLKQQQEKPLAININADSHIDNFVSRDQISNKDFLNWKKLSLNKIKLDIAENDYSIDTIKVDQLYSRVLIRKDKTINVNDIAIGNAKTEESKPEQQAAKDVENNPVKFKINQFMIVDGVSDFSDQSLILPFSAHINQLKGSVKGISSDKKATIKVALDGRVDNLAPVIIKGKITPATGNSNFSLDFNSMPLPIITPYMAEFAGRKIEKGNMTLGLKYKIHNKQLTASNSLLIDQLVLGDEVENPEAVSLPLGLAIALLQDADGKIALDVPITGDLDSPEFSVGSIIVDALVNVISKIVTSPFYAIASLIDSDEDISKITFSAGSAELDEQQQNKLSGLVTALSKRPNLQLEIKGAAYSSQDWPLMQAMALDHQINQLRNDELIKEGNKKLVSNHLSPSDKNYQRLLADLFIAKFPTLAKRSIFGTPKLIDEKMGEFHTVAKTKLAEIIPANTQSLQDLAVERALAISTYLVKKEIEIKRLFLLDVDVDPERADQLITSNLSLTTE